MLSGIISFSHSSKFINQIQFSQIVRSVKYRLDRSKFPILEEKDLYESFIKGSGPGGQNVNKRSNCVFLQHRPTKLFVKVHEFRELERNRKQARKLLAIELDNYLNGDQSVEAQKRRLDQEFEQKADAKAKLKREQKAKYKEYLNSLELKEKKPEKEEVIDESKEIELIKKLDQIDHSKSN